MHFSRMHTACSLPHMGRGWGREGALSKGVSNLSQIQPSLPISHLLKIPNASQMHQKCIRNVSQIQPSLPRSQSLKYYKNQNKHTYFFLYYLYLSQIYPKFNLLSLYLTYSNTVRIPNASQMHQKCIRNVSQIQPSLPRSQSLKYYKNQNKHTYFFLYYLYLSQIYPKFNLLSLYLTYSNTVKIPNLSQIYWLMKRASNWTKSPEYLGISPIKLKIIFPVYILR